MLQFSKNISRVAVFTIMGIHSVLLGWQACCHSPTWNEVDHLVAGLSHWEFGTFDLFRVNPPLVRMLATGPVLAFKPKVDWSSYNAQAGIRSERGIRHSFIKLNRKRVLYFLTLGRCACIPFSLLGAYICLRWARELYGPTSGVLAIGLWCFSPNILAHGHLITPDLGAAALGVSAAYMFWRWSKRPTWWTAFWAGAVLGLTELTKTTLIIFFFLWPILWLAWRILKQRNLCLRAWLLESGQLAVILIIAVYVLNLGYGFEGTFQQLGDYEFVSQTLGGCTNDSSSSAQGQNKFVGTRLARIPIPLPKNFVMGIDIQKSDFERKMWSCLCREHRLGGWWYYYLYALVVKVPLGTWCLVLSAIGVAISYKICRAAWRDEIILLGIITSTIIFVSSQDGFNRHLRYVLPIFPFAFIWISKVGLIFKLRHTTPTRPAAAIAMLVVVSFAFMISSSLWAYPHSLSYFNEISGGPIRGHNHLGGVETDSNIDWGQDLLYLKDWLARHGAIALDGLAYCGSYPATMAGIPETPYPPPSPPSENSISEGEYAIDHHGLGPRPGWHAVSVNNLYHRNRQFHYFRHFEPVAMAGYSIYIYHITLEEANLVRQDLGLPMLKPEDINVGTIK